MVCWATRSFVIWTLSKTLSLSALQRLDAISSAAGEVARTFSIRKTDCGGQQRVLSLLTLRARSSARIDTRAWSADNDDAEAYTLDESDANLRSREVSFRGLTVLLRRVLV